eukprot:212319_1
MAQSIDDWSRKTDFAEIECVGYLCDDGEIVKADVEHQNRNKIFVNFNNHSYSSYHSGAKFLWIAVPNDRIRPPPDALPTPAPTNSQSPSPPTNSQSPPTNRKKTSLQTQNDMIKQTQKSGWDERCSKYDIEEMQPASINYTKGKRALLPKIRVDYSFTREELEKLEEKYDTINKGRLLWIPNYHLERTSSVSDLSRKQKFFRLFKDDVKSNDELTIKLKPKQRPRRPHSARYSRHYLDPTNNKQSRHYLDPFVPVFVPLFVDDEEKKERNITMDNINFTEMKLLCYRYVDENCDCFSLLKDVIKLILDKFEIIPTFDGKQQRKVDEIAWTRLGLCHGLYPHIFRKIECFEENGYTSGVRYLSIKFQYGGCTNDFGITNKRDYVR